MKMRIQVPLAVLLTACSVRFSTALGQGVGRTNWVDLETNWVQTSAPAEAWSSVAISADGLEQAAVCSGALCTSTDGGTTWTPSTFLPSGSPVACSADGSRLVAGGGDVFVSDSSGVTWAQTSLSNNPGTWGRIASSADGTTLVAGSVFSPGWIYMSTNSGTAWWPVPMLAGWGQITISADGTNVLALAGNYAAYQVFASTNRGVNWYWINLPGFVSWTCVAASASGVKLVVCANGNYGSAGIYTSTDAGVSWRQNTVPNLNWSCVASSADGSILAAAGGNGGIYISMNSGSTWIETTAPVTGWNSLAMSADGTKLAAVNGDGIWTAHARIIPFVPPSLHIAAASGQDVLYWPTWASDYVLECATDLSSTNWTAVTNGTPVIAVILTNAPPGLFFRLRQF